MKRLFGTKEAKKAFVTYCDDEFKVHDGESGTWYITMRMELQGRSHTRRCPSRSLAEMKVFHDKQAKLRMSDPRKLGQHFMKSRDERKEKERQDKEQLIEQRVSRRLANTRGCFPISQSLTEFT